MSTITTSFSLIQTKAVEAAKSAATLDKVSKVITQLTEVVTKAGYKSLAAFYDEVDALATGKAPVAKPAAAKAPSAAKEPKKPRKASTGGKRPSYTDADKQKWRDLYQGEAKGSITKVAALFGKPKASQSIRNLKDKENWVYVAPTV